MFNPIPMDEFEQMLRKIFAIPEPDSKFLEETRARFVSAGRVAAETKPLSFLRKSSARRTLAYAVILILVVALLAFSPTVARALQMLFGYIPGAGIVDQGSTILVLAEPVMIQRDGVTLTLELAVATSEKTVVVYRHVEEPVDYENYQAPETYPEDRPALRLPDGRKLDVVVGHRQPSDGAGILYALEFGPLPTGVTEVTLELTRLAGMLPGAGPENWTIPIQFKEGDPAQVSFPVFAYEPTPTVTIVGGAGEQTAQPAYGISITLDKAVELPDGYILMGSAQWIDVSILPQDLFVDLLTVKDAEGHLIEFERTQPEMNTQPRELRNGWAFRILTKEFVVPLSLNFYIQLRIPSEARFQFDPGLDPQNGQTWDLNLDVPVAGHIVKIVSAQYQEDPAAWSFVFTMTSDSNVIGAQIFDVNHPPMGFGGGGGTPQTNVPFTSSYAIEGDYPADPMSFAVVWLDVLVPGDWTITWDPAQP
ncbi:MAG: hypothetical protein M1347_05725 [Chloroflexi bacterium]|nr:hypothetical protein [Chloroflexota bacterium]